MQIDLWYAPAAVDQPQGLEDRCSGWLSSDEVERADRFRRPTTRHQFVVGRGMCRCLIGERLAIDPCQIRFHLAAHGKPQLAEPPSASLQFNVAHTEGMVLCGLVDGLSIGVDIERLGRRTDLGLAERYFAPSEVDWVFRQPEAEQLPAFLRVWTLKESFIKAIGTGLSTPLDAFAFQQIMSPRPTIEFRDRSLGKGDEWQFFVPELEPGFVGAVAVGGAGRASPRWPIQLTVRRFDPLPH